MSENLDAAIPAPVRVITRLQSRNASPEVAPKPTEPAPAEDAPAEVTLAVKKGSKKARVQPSKTAAKPPAAKKKVGRPKGTTKAALAAKVLAAAAAAAAEAEATTLPGTDDPSPPPYSPSVEGKTSNTGVDLEGSQEDSFIEQNPSTGYLARAYQFISEQESGGGDCNSTGIPSVQSNPAYFDFEANLTLGGMYRPLASTVDHTDDPVAPDARISSRPSSRQSSVAINPTPMDHMGKIAEEYNFDDSLDVSLYQPRPSNKAKAGGRKAAKVAADEDTSSEEEGAGYEDLKEIPYVITLCKVYYQDVCSPTDWEGNVDKWAFKLGALKPNQIGSPVVQRPIFAIRTADKAATSPPTMILDEKAWIVLIKEANEQEKKVFIAKQKKLRTKPKSMFPFYVSQVLNSTEQTNAKSGSGKGSGKGWNPKGPGSGRDNGPGLFSGMPNAGYLRAVLQGEDTTPFELDRGQRNDDQLPDGHLNSKTKSNADCKALIFQKYRCRTHGAQAKEVMCYLPTTGDFVGQHIRIEAHSLLQLIIHYMRANPGFDVEADAMPASIVKQLIQAHRDYLARKDGYTNPGPNPGLGGSSQQPANAGLPALPDPRARPSLNRRLDSYPGIEAALQTLQDTGTSGRNYVLYTRYLTEDLGAQTIGELLLMVYEDVDVSKQCSREGITASEAIIRYVKEGFGPTLPRILATLMIHEFETLAKDFEARAEY